MRSIAYVGLDVHRDSIAAAVYVGNDSEPLLERTLPNEFSKVGKVFRRWNERYDLRCCYEASSCGYVLQRWLTELGICCEIAAPSMIPVRAGERKKKSDRLDAKKLAKLYRAGELTMVRIPSEAEESVRGLVRCRETVLGEVRRSMHHVLKFLQTRGFVYREGNNWTDKHWRYLWSLKFDGVDGVVWREYLCLLEYKLSRLEELDKQIEEIAFSDAYKELVGRLRCLRGVGTHTAMVLISEVGDFSRFGSAEELMSFFGLAPGCRKSGNSSSRCSITKAGNSRCRRVLVEAAWHYRHKPRLSARLRARQSGQDPQVIATSWKAQHRLHKKYWRLSSRMLNCKAVVAVARELAGFVWAITSCCSEVQVAEAA